MNGMKARRGSQCSQSLRGIYDQFSHVRNIRGGCGCQGLTCNLDPNDGGLTSAPSLFESGLDISWTPLRIRVVTYECFRTIHLA